nr:sigma factor [Clostridioides mangenotii]
MRTFVKSVEITGSLDYNIAMIVYFVFIWGDIHVSSKRKSFEEMSASQIDDYNLVIKASAGDKIALEYLISKYKNFVKAKAKSYFLIGADKEDIIQEGMIGLYKAIRDFDGTKRIPLVFADICILDRSSQRLKQLQDRNIYL